MSALESQVGGDHYKNMGMQPFVFTMGNNWDALAHTILKYVSRHGSKNGRQDLLKAIHCCGLRAELVRRVHQKGIPVIPIEDYIEKNGILCPSTRAALVSLSDWVYAPWDTAHLMHRPASVILPIEDMIATYYPEK